MSVRITKVFERFAVCSLVDVESFNENTYANEMIIAVVSMGCTTTSVPDVLHHFAFLDIKDECHQFLIDFWFELRNMISHLQEFDTHASGTIVIHCVHGQSRSAATAIALQLLLNLNSTFDESYSALKIAKPDISINPSFLYQLKFLESLRKSFFGINNLEFSNLNAIIRLLFYQYSKSICEDDRLSAIDDRMKQWGLQDAFPSLLFRNGMCMSCRQYLFSDLNIISESCIDEEVIQKLQDEYWENYVRVNSSVKKRIVTLPSKGYIFTYPTPWMLDQIFPAKANGMRSQQLVCPHCQFVIGMWETEKLNVVCPYLPCDGFSFMQRSIFLQRKVI